MNANLPRAYAQSNVKAASPGKLVIMLYDGLVRFATEARDGLKENKVVGDKIDRCIKILTELNIALKFDAFPELCTELSRLYEYFVTTLSNAMHEKRPEDIDKILPLIISLRDAWIEAESQLEQKASVTQA